MTTKERLHQLVDQLSADDALRYIVQRREDPVIAAWSVEFDGALTETSGGAV